MFIVIEGPDGSGKTTQSKMLAEVLDGLWMCFPDRTTFFGGIIDRWLKQEWSAKFKPSTLESALYAEHNEKVVDAAVFQALQTMNRLELATYISLTTKGFRPLICDRYWMSGVAYGGADGLDELVIENAHRLLPEPDLCILIDTPLDIVLGRLEARTDSKKDLYESRGRAYFTEVYANYSKLWTKRARTDKRWKRIRPSDTIEETQHQIWDLVQDLGEEQ